MGGSRHRNNGVRECRFPQTGDALLKTGALCVVFSNFRPNKPILLSTANSHLGLFSP